MSRHPDYEGKCPLVCCDESPDFHNSELTYACTKPRYHHGDHVAHGIRGNSICSWSNPKPERPPLRPFVRWLAWWCGSW